MFKVKSLDKFTIEGRGLVYSILSPVACDRGLIADAIGPEIEIDGVVYLPRAYELFMKCTPITLDEPIGILVSERKDDGKQIHQADIATTGLSSG